MNSMLYCIPLIYFNEFKNASNWSRFSAYYKGCSLLTKPGVSHVLYSEVERKGILLYCLKLPVETIDILANYFLHNKLKEEKKGMSAKFLKN